jgi:hypothetical protein
MVPMHPFVAKVISQRHFAQKVAKAYMVLTKYIRQLCLNKDGGKPDKTDFL